MSSISLLILTFNRPKLLKKCLNSVQREFKNAEVMVVINGEDNFSESMLKEEFSWVKIKKMSATTLGAARNKAIDELKGEWIFFFDDDSELPLGYGEKALSFISENKAPVFGGPDITAGAPTSFQASLGLVMGSFLVSGMTFLRHASYGEEEIECGEESLILCNLWIKRDLFSKYQFPENLMRNEENVLLHEMKKNNVRMMYHPKLWVYHHRKENLKLNLKAVFSSAKHRAKTIKQDPSSIRLQYFIPSLFYVSVILSLIFFPALAALILSFYLSILVLESIRLGLFFNWRFMPLLMLHFLSMHSTYAFGFIYGLRADN